MSTPGYPLPSASSAGSKPDLFATPPREPPGSRKIIAAVVAITLIAIALLAFFLHQNHSSNLATASTIAPLDPYSAYLTFSQLAMSESTSLSGGKSTFIDGRVKNSGSDIISGVTMQVLFRNDVALPPQVETLPLTLIRTHDPYVDTEPVSAAPLKSGDEAEFRLIFETVTGSWNQQMPELRVIHVSKK